jgi:hypothetical protein
MFVNEIVHRNSSFCSVFVLWMLPNSREARFFTSKFKTFSIANAKVVKCLGYSLLNDGFSLSLSPFLFILSGVRLNPLGTAVTIDLLHQPQMIDDCGAIRGMKVGRGNQNTRRKPAPVPLCPLQIPHDLTWARTQAAAVGSQRLTA